MNKNFALEYMQNKLFKCLVWFKIYNNYNEYWVIMYYDNLHNKVNGEDL